MTMRERPILFNAPMVRAILDGRKTQFRRPVKGATGDWEPVQPKVFSPTVIDRRGDEQPGPESYGAGNADGDCWISCPYGQPGDRLWVRETCGETPSGNGVVYQADNQLRPKRGDEEFRAFYRRPADVGEKPVRWTPSIHMPRWASRITLEITDVRVQRVQDISAEDCIAEGLSTNLREHDAVCHLRDQFADLWNSTYGPDAWNRNDWVWAVSFKRAAP